MDNSQVSRERRSRMGYLIPLAGIVLVIVIAVVWT